MTGTKERHAELTDRQCELLKLMSEGVTDKDIALRMHLSDRQIRREVTMMMQTFNTHSRFQLGVAAARWGLLTLQDTTTR